jgi:hypothetical protein
VPALGQLLLPGSGQHSAEVANRHHDVHLRRREGLHGAADLRRPGGGQQLLGHDRM